MSHHTIIIATRERNNNSITNFHIILKMIVDCKELMLTLLFVYIGGFALRSHAKAWVDSKTLCGPSCYEMFSTP
jgi:hypothetical protein